MADSLVTTGAPTTTFDGRPAFSPANEILRDIARGGFAGIIVGFLVAGIGGRLVMRLATILHEGTVGIFTEKGFVIGEIDLRESTAFLFFSGVGIGLVAGTIWVIVSPWLPGRGLGRASVTAIAAIALGTPALVQRTNSDFEVFGHDPMVVVLLIGLVGLVGFSIAVVDGALDARLPHPLGWIMPSTTVYLIVTLIGLILVLPLVVAFLLDRPEFRAPIRAGWALAALGACTLSWWVVRVMGRSTPPKALRMAGRVSLLIAVVLGVATSLPHVLSAAGMPL